MEGKRYAALSLLGLVALCSALSQTNAVTMVQKPSARPPIPSPAAESLPCGSASSVALTAAEFPVHLLPARSMTGPANTTFLTEPLWLDPNRVINVLDGTDHLAVFDSGTGKQIPLGAMNALREHQEVYKNPFSIRISPNGQWILWPSGSNAQPTWAVLSLDGQQYREWPRASSDGAASVAWMQDNQHWVELSETGWQPETQMRGRSFPECQVRVYDTLTPNVKEFPLRFEAPLTGRSFTTQQALGHFIFTQDGRAWLSSIWSYTLADSAHLPASRLDTYELTLGKEAWTLHPSNLGLGSLSEIGTLDECARSPDDNWLIWRNYASNGKGPMRLVLTRTDGSKPQVIYTSPEGQNFGDIHWAGDSKHVAFYQGNAIFQLTLPNLETAAAPAGPCASVQVVSRPKTQGKFPVAAHQNQHTAQLPKAPADSLR